MITSGPDPALVEGRHEQKHADDRQREDEDGHVAGLLLLKRGAGPFVRETFGQAPTSATRSMAAIAWPELYPGAGWPVILAALYML